ncbi:MAG: glycosyltransferase family 2 protein [Candidatus Hydrogenedentes bacterium]|nr:glycosyltransferase family 2 protein [Candidatus Hydrogenedentota bacterium]
MNKRVDISVVVCTYNRAAMLERALKSLAVQQCPAGIEFEIVVVDDGSTDNTGEIVREANRCTDRRVSYIRESGRGISAARNRGVDAARGEWIAFTDDDQIADGVWLWNLWFAQGKTGASCVGGARTLELHDDVLRSLPMQTRLILGEIAPVGELHPCTRDSLLCTGNLLVRRDLVLKVGGFDEALTQGGEDTDLLMRLRASGQTCWFTPHAVVRHIIPPYRLEMGYLTWSAMRGGDCFAVRDVREWGALRPSLIAIARLAQANFVHAPAMVYARLLGRDAAAIAGRCRIARAMAYAKRVAALVMFPVRVEAASHGSRFDFRGERRMFDQPVG